MQQFCQGSTSGFGDMLSYQNYKISEVGSGISVIITEIIICPAQQNTASLSLIFFHTTTCILHGYYLIRMLMCTFSEGVAW